MVGVGGIGLEETVGIMVGFGVTEFSLFERVRMRKTTPKISPKITSIFFRSINGFLDF